MLLHYNTKGEVKMPALEIVLSDDQIKVIQKQVFNLISTEIMKIKDGSDKQRYMNKKQTCSYLQISNNTLDHWIDRGLPVIKINGVVRFDSLAIDKWLSSKV